MDSSKYTFEDLFKFDLGLNIQKPIENILEETNKSTNSFHHESMDNSFAKYQNNSNAYKSEVGPICKVMQPSTAFTSINVVQPSLKYLFDEISGPTDETDKYYEKFNLAENNQEIVYCAFCLKNNEPTHVVCSHYMKEKNGKILCPILKKHVCEICGATGELAHTRKYCPANKNHEKRGRKTRKLANGREVNHFNHK
ncbi:uncharacterized protein nanos [Diabrotica undecimpunctata]|uniref:uncharacterized protein nanos n=1 Tax=Diabrotica undecimpunctata TaxID=50387 RepID=UPI003B6367D9